MVASIPKLTPDQGRSTTASSSYDLLSRAREVLIIPIPTIPITVAMPAWFSPKIGPPQPIRKAPNKHTVTPNTRNAIFPLTAPHLCYSFQTLCYIYLSPC